MTSHIIDRRRLLALGGMAFAALGGLAGCGGGGDDAGGGAGNGGSGAGGSGGGASGGNPGAGTPGTAVSAGERVAALDAVAAELSALSGAGPSFDSAALVQRLQTMSAFQSVGVSDRMQNVWALFTDGRALVVPNNLEPLPSSAPAALAAARRERALGDSGGDDLPAMLCDQQYRQIDTFGQIPLLHGRDAEHLCDIVVNADTLPDLRHLAIGRGFVHTPQVLAAAPDDGHDNGIEGLRSISGDGVFFFNGTAAEALLHNGSPRTAICTATPANAVTEAHYADELRSSTLVYTVTPVGAGDRWHWMPRLAITPEFAFQNRWSFPARCVGILNLTGGVAVADDWLSVLRSAGLRSVFYWKGPMSVARMIAFADDLMQLLLASNRLRGASRHGITWPPRLRTHGIGETIQFLAGAGLANDGGGQSRPEWIPETNPALYVNTLLPTIDYATIREGTREIELIGQFGAARGADDIPGVAQARFGTQFGGFDEGGQRLLSERAQQMLRDAADPPLTDGNETLPTRQWKGDVITFDGDRLGPRGGYLQVRNGGRVSNALPITYWKIPVHIVHEVDGALRTDCTIELHLRADVSAHRLRPGQTPGESKRIIALASMFESDAHFTASGELSDVEGNVTTTLTWSGGSSAGNPAPGQHQIGCFGMLEWDRRRASIAITGGAGTCLQRTVKRRGAELLSDVTEPLGVTAAAVPRPEAALEFVFGERWELLAGGQASVTDTTFLLGRARTRTTTVRWEPVHPECPPRDDFGGV